MTEETWTPLKLLNWTKDHFASKGIQSPRLEAELLLSAALDCRRIDLYARHDEVVPAEKLGGYREMVKRRAAREPTQYVLGQTEFCGLVFKSDPRALIPRPETEIIIEVTTELAGDLAEPLLVDVGTGSGVLAVTAALRLPQAKIVACDISAEALSLAHENAEHHRVLERIELHCGDFEEVLAGPAGGVAVAMANLPYVREEELVGLAPEVREHEPRAALVAGPDGTEMLARFIAFAPALLKPGGHLVMEVGFGQADHIRPMIEKANELELVRFEKDFSGIERVAVVQRAR